MKVRILRNIGTADLKKLGAADRKDLLEKAVVDVPSSLGNELIKRKLAEHPTMQGVEPAPGITGVNTEEESPVDNMNAPDAIDAVSRFRSKDKLQHIVDNDPRKTVSEAAKKRLTELG